MLNKLWKKKNKKQNSPPADSFDSESFSVPNLSYFDFLGPNGLDFPENIRDHGYIQEGAIGDYPFRTFILEFGTTSLSTGSLDVLYRAGAINLNFFITKLTKNQAIKSYKDATTDEGARLLNMIKAGKDIEAREAQRSLDNAHRLLEEISDGYNDGFLGTLLVTVFAQDEKILDHIGMILQDNLIANDHHLRICYNRQRSGFISTLPIANNRFRDKNDRRFFDRTAIVAASPFYSSEIPYTPGSVPVGINLHTGKMEFLNVFANYLDNYSSIIVGTSGSGKSFTCKWISSSQILLGYRIFSIDPDGENGPICRLLGGREVEIREGGAVCINPCVIAEEEVEVTEPDGRRKMVVVVPLGPKIGQLLKFYDRLVGGGGLTSEEKHILKEAINKAYADAGITEDPASLYLPGEIVEQDPDTGEIKRVRQRKPEVTLMDIYKCMLVRCTNDPNLETLEYTSLRVPFAERLLTVLRGYLRDYPDGALLDGQTNFGDGKPVDNLLDNVCWVNFNIKAIEGSEIFDVVMLVLTQLGWEYFIKRASLRKYKKRVKLEEGWRMKRITGGMAFVEEMARRSRKYNGGIDVITQDIAPFLDDPDGVALIKMATSAIFLRLGQLTLEEKLRLKGVFNFSEGELDIICRRPPESERDDSRGEAILRVGGSSAFIKVKVSDEIRKFIDTDPDWLQKNNLLPVVEDDEAV